MPALTPRFDQFRDRHLGPDAADTEAMLQAIGVQSLDELIDQTVPANIRDHKALNVPPAVSEYYYLQHLKGIARRNKVLRSFIGMGYYNTVTPSVILRNVFSNPGWYTQYTPYQAEIAQGRLESLLNYQTMVADLTGLPIANASLLDEGTAAAEAMTMLHAVRNKRVREEAVSTFLVSDQVLPQTIAVLQTRAEPLGITIDVRPVEAFDFPADKVFGMLLQYPGADGLIFDPRELVARAKAAGAFTVVATDLLALTMLTPPGEWGADVVVGNSQRFGVPMGFGGPHAAFFATQDEYKRQIPGRIIGVSQDRHGHYALRMALQTREQHIRREKATSNICTAQALLANMAAFYAVYHGAQGLKAIAQRTHHFTVILADALRAGGFTLAGDAFFDTLHVAVSPEKAREIRDRAETEGYNFFYPGEGGIRLSFDESVATTDLQAVCRIFGVALDYAGAELTPEGGVAGISDRIPASLVRQSAYLTHPNFNSYRTETTMMRYIKRLENKDLSLVHSMIPLGSCTMKLNAATQLIPVSWPEFADLHPFAPIEQAQGYQQIFAELERDLAEICGFTACSLQPNSGASGEYAGLLVIRAYHHDRGDFHRNVAIIPESAHGTNPASAVMAGMQVVVVKSDAAGNIDLADLKEKVAAHRENLSCLMITYPSTYGVFETGVTEFCELVHAAGGMVYMDGANMNAQVGLTSPGRIGADVCHLNLHKTFAIPHGGGGPGMGPICCNEKLAPYLPGHPLQLTGGQKATQAVAAAPWGSASILLISYAYIRLLGAKGLKAASEYAILNANYIKARIEAHYDVLFTGEKGRAAHELILDLRPFKTVMSAGDLAKRLIDYGYHAPTLSWPVAGTVMIEPTESESKEELDRFCDALIAIRAEADAIARGEADAHDNVLVNAPHTVAEITADAWSHPYGREAAAYPLPYLRQGYKFWPSVGRVDDGYGDRNFVCTCPPVAAYAEE
ncbi:aminomethyl-transferring glycine dehydrogenase [Neolewinella lacunae]|uniref:Glycine dehydrogenase (decarboxylating) n=1 Tax=Neolewinella lacunae TaxID=1517758 RepID=A0A923TF76_9BACT|nr:aminomethyl-transferring glycine dehydrogenase [Neolewinella lacunae]MBC6996702.1 aminomethyl-transferring glycine dehydrogenase [Neolewinella lacunae]MDN3633433.1 aminomethyl-transferring glycine dehydrogenase [Neolewinella lacunae]